MINTGLPNDGILAFEAVLLPDRRLIRQGAKRFAEIETTLFRGSEQPHGALEVASCD